MRICIYVFTYPHTQPTAYHRVYSLLSNYMQACLCHGSKVSIRKPNNQNKHSEKQKPKNQCNLTTQKANRTNTQQSNQHPPSNKKLDELYIVLLLILGHLQHLLILFRRLLVHRLCPLRLRLLVPTPLLLTLLLLLLILLILLRRLLDPSSSSSFSSSSTSSSSSSSSSASSSPLLPLLFLYLCLYLFLILANFLSLFLFCWGR